MKKRKLLVSIEIDPASVFVQPITASFKLEQQLSDTIRSEIARAVSLYRDELLK